MCIRDRPQPPHQVPNEWLEVVHLAGVDAGNGAGDGVHPVCGLQADPPAEVDAASGVSLHLPWDAVLLDLPPS
eukprot:8130061-Ditylum_brightwellii.AAC.1